jgi:hypothetical protein
MRTFAYLAVAITIFGPAIAAPRSATAAVFGIFNGVAQQVCAAEDAGCGLPTGYFSGPPGSYVPSWSISTPVYSITNGPASADTQLIANLAPGQMHAFASSGASITTPLVNGRNTRGYSALSVSSLDQLNFFSSTLPPGSTVDFTITGVLHSTLAFNQTGACGAGQVPAALASMGISGGLQGIGAAPLFAPGTFTHSSCGQGNNLMTATQLVHAPLGGAPYGIVTDFVVVADAGFVDSPFLPAGYSARQTVDASNTANLVINVLTPGVTFVSNSGYAYQPLSNGVPEPATWILMISGFGALGIALRRRRLAVC